jgi:hypothetical protein
MATAPRIRSNSPDVSELGIKVFNPAASTPRNETVIQMGEKPTPPAKALPFDQMSERQQIRMLWGRRRKTGKSKNKKKKKRSTRRR